MTKRDVALQMIRIDVAQHGRVTAEGLRAFLENRVSREAFNSACVQGLLQYQRRQAGEGPHEKENTQ